MNQPIITMYRDTRGCTYYVKRGIGEELIGPKYRAHKRMPDGYLRVCDAPGIEWRDTEADALHDLIALAERRNWQPVYHAEVDMLEAMMGGSLQITPAQRDIIARMGDEVYTAEYLADWINRRDALLYNRETALQFIGARAFYRAVLRIEEKMLEIERAIDRIKTPTCHLVCRNATVMVDQSGEVCWFNNDVLPVTVINTEERP